MRIVLISSYPPIDCGVATYSYYLTKELEKLGNEVHVICHTSGKKEKNVYPILNGEKISYSKKIMKMIEKINPDIVHIQHEWGLYDRDTFNVYLIPLLIGLYSRKIPTVITFHTVLSKEYMEPYDLVFELIIRTKCSFIVHTKEQYDELKMKYLDIEIYQLPHGVRKVMAIKDAKKRLGLKGKVVLLIGWIKDKKGFDEVVKIFPDVIKSVRAANLVIAGSVRPTDAKKERNLKYKVELKKLIKNSEAKNRIKFFDKILSDKEFDMFFSAADLVVLPYHEITQSGILANCFAFGKPVVVTNVGGNKEQVEESKTGMVVADEEELRDAIIKILKDDEIRKKFSENSITYGKKLQWEIIVKKLIKIYYNAIFNKNAIRGALTVFKDILKFS